MVSMNADVNMMSILFLDKSSDLNYFKIIKETYDYLQKSMKFQFMDSNKIKQLTDVSCVLL